jgi:hypothetical protein
MEYFSIPNMTCTTVFALSEWGYINSGIVENNKPGLYDVKIGEIYPEIDINLPDFISFQLEKTEHLERFVVTISFSTVPKIASEEWYHFCSRMRGESFPYKIPYDFKAMFIGFFPTHTFQNVEQLVIECSQDIYNISEHGYRMYRHQNAIINFLMISKQLKVCPNSTILDNNWISPFLTPVDFMEEPFEGNIINCRAGLGSSTAVLYYLLTIERRSVFVIRNGETEVFRDIVKRLKFNVSFYPESEENVMIIERRQVDDDLFSMYNNVVVEYAHSVNIHSKLYENITSSSNIRLILITDLFYKHQMKLLTMFRFPTSIINAVCDPATQYSKVGKLFLSHFFTDFVFQRNTQCSNINSMVVGIGLTEDIQNQDLITYGMIHVKKQNTTIKKRKMIKLVNDLYSGIIQKSPDFRKRLYSITNQEFPSHIKYFDISKLEDMSEEKVNVTENCTICISQISNPIRTQCNHFYCYDCISSWSQMNDRCPLCKVLLNNDMVRCVSSKKRKIEPVEKKYVHMNVFEPTVINFISGDFSSTNNILFIFADLNVYNHHKKVNNPEIEFLERSPKSITKTITAVHQKNVYKIRHFSFVNYIVFGFNHSTARYIMSMKRIQTWEDHYKLICIHYQFSTQEVYFKKFTESFDTNVARINKMDQFSSLYDLMIKD